ncbi:twin-arginine translocase TatA/TatE family subunit [Luteolibacter rhizosphaerae]|uniref:twin-arginine translocase TatA/TatE family subunit n=1 Tax=Luteolibacter rhizosphaerae TaxID=2989719 RepID=UPI003CE466D6
MGGLGGQEMIIIFLIVLLLFGAKKLPELARGVGKSMGEFKKARDDFEREITRSEDDVRRRDEAKAKADDEIRIREAAGKEPVEKA